MFLTNQAAVIGFMAGLFFILIRDICLSFSHREFSSGVNVFNIARFITSGVIFGVIAIFLNFVYSLGSK